MQSNTIVLDLDNSDKELIKKDFEKKGFKEGDSILFKNFNRENQLAFIAVLGIVVIYLSTRFATKKKERIQEGEHILSKLFSASIPQSQKIIEKTYKLKIKTEKVVVKKNTTKKNEQFQNIKADLVEGYMQVDKIKKGTIKKRSLSDFLDEL